MVKSLFEDVLNQVRGSNIDSFDQKLSYQNDLNKSLIGGVYKNIVGDRAFTDESGDIFKQEIKNLVSLNLDYPVVLSCIFASLVKIHKLIDREYNTHRVLAYKQAKESVYYENDLFKRRTIEFEEYSKKVLGLLLIDEDYYVDLFLKAGFSTLYRGLKDGKSGNKAGQKGLMLGNLQKDAKGDFELFLHQVVFLYYFLEKEQVFFDPNTVTMLLTTKESIECLFTADTEFVHTNYTINKDIKRIVNTVDRFFDVYGINKNVQTFTDFYFKMYAKEFEQNGKSKLTIPIVLCEYWGISQMLITTKNTFKKKDLYPAVAMYLAGLKDGEAVDYEQLRLVLDASIVIKQLIKEFKRSKDYFFKNSNEYLYSENDLLTATNKELAAENNDLKLKLKKLEDDNKNLVRDLTKQEVGNRKQYLKDIADVKKEYTDSEKVLKEKLLEAEEKNRRLNNMLEDFENSVFKSDVTEDGLTIEDAINILGSKNILYGVTQKGVGFSSGKANGLKKLLPTISFYRNNLPAGADVLFIDWQLMSHTEYRELKKWLLKTGTPYKYITSTGVNETVIEMAEYFKGYR